MKVFFNIFLLFFFSSLAQASPVWEKINNEDGITVFRAKIPNTPIVAFKGKVIINASAKKILWVLADREHRKEWVDRLEINEDLEVKSKLERIIYQSFKTPFFTSNRDMVYRTILTRDQKTRAYKFQLNSVDHPKAPKTVGVRAKLINSSYIVKPLSKNQSEVVVEILSDPKGLLPVWLINLVQKSWPMNTLRALREQVKKDYVQEYDVDL
jgi:hypothetical protein